VSVLEHVDPNDDRSDLAAFDRVVGTTQLVGLGETVHTSGGYHRVRSRLVRHMVEKLGFRAVALETPWRTAEVATRYVESCTGTPREAARSIFGVFASVQMASDFEWLCQWNREHPTDKVAFWGYDEQEPWAHGALLRELVAGSAPEATFAKDLEACFGVKFSSLEEAYGDPDARTVLDGKRRLTDEELAACKSAVAGARSWFATNEATVASKASAAYVRFAKLALEGINADEDQTYWFPRDVKRGFEARDVYMAKALLEIRELRSAGKRVAVIAHNTHLAHAQSKVDGVYAGVRVMGQFLKEEHRADYEAIGLFARTVKINWGKFEDPPVATGPGTAEDVLHALGRPALFVDLARTSVFEPGNSYSVAEETYVPREQFRAFVYLRESEAMKYAR